MKAIVLSCDKYHVFANHLTRCYARVWPSHPFDFRVACQIVPDPVKWLPRVEFVRTPVEIKPTVEGLLRGIHDDELVYWCIDDKYPIELDVEAYLSAIDGLKGCSSEVSGLLLCRARNMMNERHLGPGSWADPQGRKYRQRANYRQIWLHQFVRAKVIRSLFDRFPDHIVNAKDMDSFKNNLSLPGEQRIFVSEINRSVFGESTSRGLVTDNCIESLAEFGLQVPAWCRSRVPWWFPRKRRRIIIGNV